jgi:hypothetical protein
MGAIATIASFRVNRIMVIFKDNARANWEEYRAAMSIRLAHEDNVNLPKAFVGPNLNSLKVSIEMPVT